jgi:hypothetical protein
MLLCLILASFVVVGIIENTCDRVMCDAIKTFSWHFFYLIEREADCLPCSLKKSGVFQNWHIYAPNSC